VVRKVFFNDPSLTLESVLLKLWEFFVTPDYF
jgi:hypothetical protein